MGEHYLCGIVSANLSLESPNYINLTSLVFLNIDAICGGLDVRRTHRNFHNEKEQFFISLRYIVKERHRKLH